ncbi:dienelactone hydrolase family protein [Amphibiibacter pelophylacis]|uniref:Dienelactone hydrolase family protein n=1 Tax=Amphibiibacter pelophylacis TaxID=1799477 RepID=A0ACC6P4N2_9BURK
MIPTPPQADSLDQTHDSARRQTLKMAMGAVGAGYALAALPLMAQTLQTTPATGLVAGKVEIPAADRSIPGYRAAPASGSAFATVLVLPEIFGLHEYIQDVCRRFARAGYMAVAIDPFVRQGDPMAIADIGKLLADIINQVPDAQVMSDLDAAARWAAANGGDAKQLAVTGFCWGGRQTWLYAAHNPAVRAGIAWYGRLVGPTSALQPRHPIDVVDKISGPVLGLYGGADTGIPQDTVERMIAALGQGSAAARASQFVIYPDAPHAFHADYRPSYREGAARDGWSRTLAWLAAQGLKPQGAAEK